MFRFVLDHVRKKGPLYDGRAALAIQQATEEAEQVLAEVGAQKVRVWFGRYVQHPTGYYMSQIGTARVGGDWKVYDHGVIYGHWLAGTGSRNAPVTRFKGYPHWKLAQAEVEAQKNEIAEMVLRRYLPRAN